MKKILIIYALTIIAVLDAPSVFAKNPSVKNGVATYTADITIGEKFLVPDSWSKIVINANVTVTGSFYMPTRTAPLEIMGIDRKTSIIHGTGARPTNDGKNGRTYSAVRGDGKNLYIHIHDLTSLNPDKFHFHNQAGSILVERCDIIENRGITQTDAVHCQTGGGTVRDCFISTYDDVCYVGQVILMENTTIQHNNNGAPFQVSWGGSADGNAMTVRNCSIIDCSTRGYNQGVVGWAKKNNTNGLETVTITWEGIISWTQQAGANQSPFYTFCSGHNPTYTNAVIIHEGVHCEWAKNVQYRNHSQGKVITKNCITASQPPAVSFTSPAKNAAFPAGSDVDVQVSASDAGGTVTLVKLYVNNHLLARQLTSSPYEWGSPTNNYDARLRNMKPGTYSLKTVAYNNTGDSTVATTSFVIRAASQAPTVSFITPANNATFSAGSDVDVQVNTSDAGGTVTLVKLYVNNHLLARQLTSPPYEWGSPTNNYDARLRNMKPGTYSLKTVAYNNTGDSSAATSNLIVSTITGTSHSTVVASPYVYFNSDKTMLYIVGESTTTKWKLYSINGTILKKGQGTQVNFSDIQPGTYLIIFDSVRLRIMK